MLREDQKFSWTIHLFFFISGFSCLVYETLWIRYFAIAYGSTTFSMSLVLSFFFLGLASGAYFCSLFVDRIGKPILVYGFLEAFIGLSAFVLIYFLENLSDLFPLFLSINSLPSTLFFGKVLVTGLLLTPITVAMGMTLPLLVKAFEFHSTSSGKIVSQLYGFNTLGAVLGALASGLILMPIFGTIGTNHLMVLSNILIFYSILQWKPDDERFSTNKDLGHLEVTLPLSRKVLLGFAAGVSGFVAMGSEVVWNKYLNLFLGTNIIGTSLTLALFLFGVGLGSLVFRKIPFEKAAEPIFLFVLSTSVIATIFCSSLLNKLPTFSLWLFETFHWPLLTSKMLMASLILLPPTLLFGSLFPLLVHMGTHRNSSGPRTSGKIYTWNTLGGIFGAFCTGIFLIPLWGSSTALFVLCGVQFIFLFVWVTFQFHSKEVPWQSLAYLTTAGVILVTTPSLSWQNLVRSVEFSYSNPHASLSEWTQYLKDSQQDLRFWAEGENAIVSLHYEVIDGKMDKNKFILKSNGLKESFFDLQNPGVIPRYEALLALLPYFYHQNLSRNFVIGYGGGYTAEVLSSFPEQDVVVAEIEEKMVEASEYAYLGPNSLLNRPNLSLEYQDARFLLSITDDHSLDSVVSQPSHSWMSGSSHLFTKNFFELVKLKLNSGGIFSQWLNLYNMDSDSLRSLLATFYEVFPYGVVYNHPGDLQLILIGSLAPLNLRIEKLKEIALDPFWQERLVHLPLNNEIDLLSYFAFDREQALRISKDSIINSDRNAFSEIRQSQLFYDIDDPSKGLQNFLSDSIDSKSAVRKQIQWDLLKRATK